MIAREPDSCACNEQRQNQTARCKVDKPRRPGYCCVKSQSREMVFILAGSVFFLFYQYLCADSLEQNHVLSFVRQLPNLRNEAVASTRNRLNELLLAGAFPEHFPQHRDRDFQVALFDKAVCPDPIQ